MQHKTFFFALLAVSFIAIIPSAFADSQGPPNIQRFRDHQIVSYPNGTHVGTFGMAENVYDGYNWVDRIIANNGTHYNVYSEMGSFSFNKSTCTITQYVKGFNPISAQWHSKDIVIDNWFWTVARKNGANPWTVLDASMFDCAITTSSNSTGKYLTMKRTDLSSGSYLRVTLAAPKDKPIEDFDELYMNRTAWNGNKFAFVLWAKGVHADTITTRNGTAIPIPNGVTMIDRSGLTTNSLDFIRNGNPFYFDWGKAAPYFKTLLLNKTGSNVDVQFGFNNNAAALNVGQRIFLDPTYGYTAGTVYNIKSTNGNCATNNNGSTNPYIGSDGVICYYVVTQWDTTAIPDADVVTDTKIRYDVPTFWYTINCDAVSISNKPSTANNATRQADIKAGTVYADVPNCDVVGNDNIQDLGTTADADVQSHLAANWFAVGFRKTPDMLAANAFTQFGATIELQVTYVVPAKPDRVSTLTATTAGTTSIDLAWTAPYMGGLTCLGYQINYTTPYGNPTTILSNNTGVCTTAYTVSGLTDATEYSFRVSARNSLGVNGSGNIANATTGFVPANFTIGSFNFNSQNPLRMPFLFHRMDVNTTTYVNVTYSYNIVPACDIAYMFAQTNHTYHTITGTPVSSIQKTFAFQFTNSSNDQITINCWDQNGTDSTGRYIVTQSNFLLKQLIQNFRNGTYGTHGQFGAIDLVTLVIIIFAMIGFNRISETVGAVFAVMIIFGLAYFDIISWASAVLQGAIVTVVMLVLITTRKD